MDEACMLGNMTEVSARINSLANCKRGQFLHIMMDVGCQTSASFLLFFLKCDCAEVKFQSVLRCMHIICNT
jgi:hypothetical protein